MGGRRNITVHTISLNCASCTIPPHRYFLEYQEQMQDPCQRSPTSTKLRIDSSQHKRVILQQRVCYLFTLWKKILWSALKKKKRHLIFIISWAVNTMHIKTPPINLRKLKLLYLKIMLQRIDLTKVYKCLSERSSQVLLIALYDFIVPVWVHNASRKLHASLEISVQK